VRVNARNVFLTFLPLMAHVSYVLEGWPLLGVFVGVAVVSSLGSALLTRVFGEQDPDPPRVLPLKIAIPWAGVINVVACLALYTAAEPKSPQFGKL
jgi:hypothetical protein